MEATHVIAVDLANLWKTATSRKTSADFYFTVAWGDPVRVHDITDRHVELETVRWIKHPDGSLEPAPMRAFIRPSTQSLIKPQEVVREFGQNDVLKIDFVDVQQGDGSVIETPQGQVVLIDGGDNQLFARYLAGRFRNTSVQQPQDIACIVVTHGDADHFAGLSEIHKSETHPDAFKRLFICPQRVYHNGLVKRPSSVPERQLLGQTEQVGDVRIITELENDLLTVDDAKLNQPFRAWKRTLQTYNQRRLARGVGPILIRRLSQGDHAAFDFLGQERVTVEVLGPLLTRGNGREGLKCLGAPPPGPRLGQEGTTVFSGYSPSHTINGHSIILRVTYGNLRMLFAGDLNQEAELELARQHPDQLVAEIFKVPHHGSADFSPTFLKAVSPIISVISSGDESARHEFIHPRANLVGALGRCSRAQEPLIFVTEMVAFFNVEGFVGPPYHAMTEVGTKAARTRRVVEVDRRGRFFSFSRTAFGIVKVRTNGTRLLVFTNSGQADLKEAYAYEVPQPGQTTPVRVRLV
jgi:beta-lactamase superfamily II metal-dependent hydrolase